MKGLSDTQVANIGLAVALVHSLPLFFRKGPRIWAEFTFRTLILALRVPTPFEITAEGYPQAFTGLDCASPCLYGLSDQLDCFLAIPGADQFSLSPQIACAFFVNTKSADNSAVTLSFRSISLWDKR